MTSLHCKEVEFLTVTEPGYLEFTAESSALDYLEKTVFFLEATTTNPLDWKWVILAIHGALYGFMICALKGTNPDNVCENTKAGQKLIAFQEALKRCQSSDWMAIGGFTKALELSQEQHRALRFIHTAFRNQFIHYRPTLWGIELEGMPEIVMHALDVLRAVSLEMGCYTVQYKPGELQRVAGLVTKGKNFLRPGL